MSMTDELKSLAEKVDKLNGTLETHLATNNLILAQQSKSIERLETFAYGDGNGNPGARIKIDRHDQFISRTKWGIGAIVTAVTGIIVSIATSGMHK